jgi:hypothetical protein
MEQSTKETILANLSDASATLVVLEHNLDMLIDRCEFENRYPSIQELRNLREHIDDTSTYIARVQEQINEPTRTSKKWIS